MIKRHRHGFVLAIAALMYIATGALISSYAPGTPRYEGLAPAIDVFPIEFWASVFILVGAVTLFCAILSQQLAFVGYGLITGLAAGWSATYLVGVLVYDTAIANLSLFVWWALNTVLWWSISGLLNPRSPDIRKG